MDPREFTLGKHVKLDDESWLPVRYVDQSTLHEEPTTGAKFIDHEKFIELRNRKGEARFISLWSERVAATRDSGPCRGIKPYFWKGANGGQDQETLGVEDNGGGHSDDPVGRGEVEEVGPGPGDVRTEPPQVDAGEGGGIGDGPDDPGDGDQGRVRS